MALVTGNVSVRKALEQIAEPSRILNTIKLAHASLAEEGHAAPRLVVAALNPQMGDNVFGEEETRLIGPAVAAARALGMAVTGPVAADTAYRRAARGEFDAVVCAEAGCGRSFVPGGDAQGTSAGRVPGTRRGAGWRVARAAVCAHLRRGAAKLRWPAFRIGTVDSHAQTRRARGALASST